MNVGAWVSEPIKEDLERERGVGADGAWSILVLTWDRRTDRRWRAEGPGRRTRSMSWQVTLHFDPVSVRLSATSPSHLFYIKKNNPVPGPAQGRGGKVGGGGDEDATKSTAVVVVVRPQAKVRDYIEARGGVGEQGATGDKQWSPGSEARGWEYRRGREGV